MAVPAIALAALVATSLRGKTPRTLAAENSKTQVPGGHYTNRPTVPSRMWIDRPINTILRNDAVGDTPAQIDAYLRQTYTQEAATHPGVRLVLDRG